MTEAKKPNAKSKRWTDREREIVIQAAAEFEYLDISTRLGVGISGRKTSKWMWIADHLKSEIDYDRTSDQIKEQFKASRKHCLLPQMETRIEELESGAKGVIYLRRFVKPNPSHGERNSAADVPSKGVSPKPPPEARDSTPPQRIKIVIPPRMYPSGGRSGKDVSRFGVRMKNIRIGL